MLRGGDFFDGIGPQGERLGGGNSLIVGSDGSNYLQLLVVDLENSPFQQCPSLILGDGVIVRCLFHDLDIPAHGAVFNGDLCGFSRLYLHSTNGGVHHISGCLDLLQLVLSGGQFLGKLDDPLLVGGVLPKEVVFGIVQIKYYPIDRRLCFSVDLLDTQGSFLPIKDLHYAGLPPGQSDLMDRLV